MCIVHSESDNLAGLPRAIIKKYGVTKKAWQVFRGRHSTKKRSVKKMARRRSVRRYFPRRRRHRSGGMTIPIAPIVGLAAGLLPPVMEAAANGFSDPIWMVDRLTANYTGFNGLKSGNIQFVGSSLMNGLGPLVAGLLIHRFVGGRPINANAALARAKVPLIRI